MNKIGRQLQKIKAENRIGLMTHAVIGYPAIDDSIRIVKAMVEAGADFIELQIPFSDPVADGPTLMRANQKALENGMTTKQTMQIMDGLSKVVDIPLLFMTYFNILLQYGVEKFCKDASKYGCSGLIVPDIPLDEEPSEHFISFCEKYNLISVRVLSPASTEERIRKNAAIAPDGFMYFVSRKGITGAQSALHAELRSNVQKLKQYFTIPIAVGFGISKSEQIQSLKGIADIAVVGSEISNVYEQKGLEAVSDFVKQLKNAAS